MRSPLDSYLHEVKKALGPLPEKRRESELLEIRQHLLNTVRVYQEQGQSEEDAAENALKDFGSARKVADNVIDAWLLKDNLWRKRISWLVAGVLIYFLSTDFIFRHSPIGQVIIAAFFMVGIWSGLYSLRLAARYQSSQGILMKRPISLIPWVLTILLAPAFVVSWLRVEHCSFLSFWSFIGMACAIGGVHNVWHLRKSSPSR